MGLQAIEARVRAVAEGAGVTRLADIGGYDRIGLPVWQAIRPRSRCLSVGLGRGASPAVARVSALMETLELHFTETIEPAFHAAPDAGEVALWGLASGDPLGWLPANDIRQPQPENHPHRPKPARVPHRLVSMDCTARVSPGPTPTSTGIAGGATLAAARRAALAELLERFAMHRFDMAPPAQRRGLRFRPEEVSGRRVHWLLARIRRANCAALAWDLSGFAGVPAVCAVVLDNGGALTLPPTLGICCRATPAAALFGALSEAVQARAAVVAGARDDLSPADYLRDNQSTLMLVLSAYADACAPAPVAAVAGGFEDALLAGLDTAGAQMVAEVVLADMSGLAFVKLLAPGVPDWRPH